jgi:hypothetical protein
MNNPKTEVSYTATLCCEEETAPGFYWLTEKEIKISASDLLVDYKNCWCSIDLLKLNDNRIVSWVETTKVPDIIHGEFNTVKTTYRKACLTIGHNNWGKYCAHAYVDYGYSAYAYSNKLEIEHQWRWENISSYEFYERVSQRWGSHKITRLKERMLEEVSDKVEIVMGNTGDDPPRFELFLNNLDLNKTIGWVVDEMSLLWSLICDTEMLKQNKLNKKVDCAL